jgi:peptidoglycan/LPS O-acetylase OafA/YrhL
MNKNAIYFSGLGGFRAICAIAVVISHTSAELRRWGLNPHIFGDANDQPIGLMLARYGVTIFFVLSGFLITYLLQEEKDRVPINIKKFYIRRLLRIWPLYYLCLTLSFIIIIIFKMPTTGEMIFYYTFFLGNIPRIKNIGIYIIGHYWSLGVEEQFYLFWPVVNKLSKNLLKLSVISIIAIIFIKVGIHILKPNTTLDRVIEVTRFHCMMIGAVAALLVKNNNKLFLSFADNKKTQLICWIIIVLVTINKYHIATVLDHEIIAIVAVLLIVGQIKIENRVINLERPIFQYLGKLSYGIYIIHMIVIFLLPRFISVSKIVAPWNYIMVFSLVLFITIILADFSYKYYESYFLRLKNKFAVVKSTSVPLSNN